MLALVTAPALAQDLVQPKKIIRVFPNGFCPVPDLGIEFTAISTKVQLEFAANISFAGHALEQRIDNLCIADAFQTVSNSAQCGICSSYSGNDTSYAAPAFFFDSFGSAGPIEVWLEKFDQDPAGRGWDLTHGVSWDDKTAPNHACGAPDDTTGSGSLVFGGPAACGDTLARTHITVTGLEPGHTYRLTWWWSADGMVTERTPYLQIRVMDQNFVLAQTAWAAGREMALRLSTGGNQTATYRAVSDGAGGVIVVWADSRTGSFDIYATRVLANGTIAPGWTTNGNPVCTSAGNQQNPAVVADGAGGVIVCWEDYLLAPNVNLYAQRITGAGTIASGWPASSTPGVAVCTASNLQQDPHIAATGDGGAIVAWQDRRSGTDDIYALRLTASGGLASGWVANGFGVCTATGAQSKPRLASDGASGAFVMFTDNLNICLQRVTGAGAIAAGWPAATTLGNVLGTDPSSASVGDLLPDGAGGVFACWYLQLDASPRVQRRTSAGAISAGWPAGGFLTCAGGTCDGYVQSATFVPDGAGGVTLAYRNILVANERIFAMRMTAGGARAAGWPTTRVTLCTSSGVKTDQTLAPDGGGGAIVGWTDERASAWAPYFIRVTGAGTVPSEWPANGLQSIETGNLHALVAPDTSGVLAVFDDYTSIPKVHRIDRFARLGNPGPWIKAIADRANDQGGTVDLLWDSGDNENLASFRSSGQFRFWRATEGSQPPVWQLLGTQNAGNLCTRSFGATTPNIAVNGTGNKTRFRIEAYDPSTSRSWYSLPDSAFSVDNLAPAKPTGLTSTPSAGHVTLHWNANVESDFSKYRVYRGTSSSFTPGPGNLVGETAMTTLVDNTTSVFYYKLSALDTHGNESAFLLGGPFGPTAVTDPSAAVEFALGSPEPNPARAGCRIDWSLPSGGKARLAIYDLLGRRVRLLADGRHEAGVFHTRWDGTDDSGRPVSSGLFFLRLEGFGRVISHRFATLR